MDKYKKQTMVVYQSIAMNPNCVELNQPVEKKKADTETSFNNDQQDEYGGHKFDRLDVLDDNCQTEKNQVGEFDDL